MKKFIVFLLLVSLVGCGYTRYAVSRTFYNGGEEFDVTPEEAGLEYSVVEFENTDGNLLHGWLIPGEKGYPLVIYFHGNVSNVTHGLETVVQLHQLGFSVFSFEYRGYGKSEGYPLFEDDFYRDARSALWWLERHGWTKSEIIYLGHSLGAAVALNLALEEPPMGIVLENAFTSYAEMLKYRAPYIYVFGGWKAREFDNLAKVSKINVPIVFFHGTADVIVPPQMSQELYDFASHPKKVFFIKGAGHVNTLELADKALLEKSLEWFLPEREHFSSAQ